MPDRAFTKCTNATDDTLGMVRKPEALPDDEIHVNCNSNDHCLAPK